MSTCINAPGTSNTATLRFSQASTTAIKNTASVETVGEVNSSLRMYARCFCPSAQPRPLIAPHHFFLRNIRYPNASLFLGLGQIFSVDGLHYLPVVELLHLFLDCGISWLPEDFQTFSHGHLSGFLRTPIDGGHHDSPPPPPPGRRCFC